MKMQRWLAAVLTALLIMTNGFSISVVKAAESSEEIPAELRDALVSEEAPLLSSDEPPIQESGTLTKEPEITAPDEAPMFSAHVEYFDGQGYIAKGTFTEFLPNTSLVQPLYSLDGEVWQASQKTWNLQWLNAKTPEDLKKQQNQICLFASEEPLASYVAGQLDHFYLKLQITLENKITYETQAALIDRGDPQPLSEKFSPVAVFTPAMRIRQWKPFKSYGQYQITISADATQEEISALLPDTLPISIDLMEGINFVSNAIVDCPVVWKPLSLSQLTPGESVTIEDAAEEIIVPAGTLLNTPTGTFWLNEPLDFDHDQIKLILNVVAENAEPTGVLHSYFAGLEISFDLKPTGATGIRAYTLSDGQSSWVETPEPLLPEKVNAPSSTASSLLTFVLTEASEPYHSWLDAWNAGDEPTPFLVALTIEGGVYNGQQLILAFPDTYECPVQPPSLNGSGGNEGNAGSDNKNDSTPEGQRPGLPQNPEDQTDAQEPESPKNPKDEQDAQEPQLPSPPKDESDAQEPTSPNGSENIPAEQKPDLPSNQQEKTDLPSGGESSPENFQAQESVPTPEISDLSAQIPIMEQTVLALNAWKRPPAVPEENDFTAATIIIGICLAAIVGKAVISHISGGFTGKFLTKLHRLFRFK